MRLFACPVLVLALVPAIASAQPRVEEQVLGPLMDNFWAGYSLAPRGVRLASVVAKGEGGVVIVDGVEGPAFDELLDTRCVDVSLPPEINDVKALDAMRAILNGPKHAHVYFSDDAARYVYGCRVGDRFVVIADGKELYAGPVEPMGWIALRFSPGGRHVVFTRRLEENRVGGFRLVVDGKPEEFSYLQPYPVFSPDGEHYAYVVTDPKDPEKHALVIDGKRASYEGVRPKIDAKGRVFSVKVNPDDGKQTLQLDGKPVFTANQVKGVYPSPTGERYAAVGAMGSQREELFIDGQSVASATVIDEVKWSPDGAHYGVTCETPQRTRYLVYDGQNGPEVDNVKDVTFAPDSSAVVYLGYFDGQDHVVLNNADIMQGDRAMPVKPFFYGPAGAQKIAFVQGPGLHDLALIMDGQMLGGLNNLTGVTFSPDGARYAFVHGPPGQGKPVHDEMEYADRIPTPFAAPSGMVGAPPPVYFVFSPDSKHLAYLVSSRQTGANGVIVDGTPIGTKSTRVGRPHFTPDSKHLFWIEQEKPYYRIYLDGEPVAQYDMISGPWESDPRMWEMGADGVFTLMGPSGSEVKRIRITPGATSIETMIAKAKGG